MFNLFLYPTQGRVVFVSMFAIDQQMNMSSYPIALGSSVVAAFSGIQCSTPVWCHKFMSLFFLPTVIG